MYLKILLVVAQSYFYICTNFGPPVIIQWIDSSLAMKSRQFYFVSTYHFNAIFLNIKINQRKLATDWLNFVKNIWPKWKCCRKFYGWGGRGYAFWFELYG